MSQPLAAAMRRYDLGIEPLGVHLQDVHPPIDVVPTFRKVIDALEEKDAIVNQAQAYAKDKGIGLVAALKELGIAA